MRVGWSTTAIFGHLNGYFFGIFRDKACNIIWRYANPCRPTNDCKREWPCMTLNGYLPPKSVFGKHSVAAKMRLLERIVQIWMKIDPDSLRQKCSPIILVSGCIRFVGIFAGVPVGGGSNESGVLDDGYIRRFNWLRLRKLRRYGKQYDVQPFVGL